MYIYFTLINRWVETKIQYLNISVFNCVDRKTHFFVELSVISSFPNTFIY